MLFALLATSGCSKDENKAKPVDTPEATKPGDTKPGETKPGETKPGETKPEAAKPVAAKPAPAKDTWVDFSSKEGRFSAKFPAQPTKSTLPTPTLVGNIDQTVFAVAQANAYYASSFADYPADLVKDSKPDNILDGARDGAANNVKGTLKGEKKIEIDGHPGREIHIEAVAEGTKVRMDARIYLVKNRLYQMIVVQPGGRVDGPSAQKFLTSFKLNAGE